MPYVELSTSSDVFHMLLADSLLSCMMSRSPWQDGAVQHMAATAVYFNNVRSFIEFTLF